jgi:Tfp pilus assembly protein PilF
VADPTLPTEGFAADRAATDEAGSLGSDPTVQDTKVAPHRPSTKSVRKLPTRLGRYEVLGVIGRGGMGTVYKAHDPELDRKVAIKVLHDDFLAGGVDAVRAEAQALARIVHPNVVAVYDVGETDGTPFVVMQLVDGVSIDQWVRVHPMSAAAIVRAFCDAGRGLAAVHAAGLIHRDVKPSNILIDRDGTVRIGDFGVAHRRANTHDDDDGNVSGTPEYMAAEQMAGRSVPASDQYAFAVSLWEMVAGARPRAADFARPPAMSLRTHRALVRARAEQPAQRLPSVAELVAALDAGRPRRNAIIAAVAVVAIAVAVALVVGRAASAPTVESQSTAAIAIAPIAIDMPHYGGEPPQSRPLAATLAQLLDQLSGIHVTGLAWQSPGVAESPNATYLLRGAIREDHGAVRAEMELVATATKLPIATLDLTRPELATLLDAIAVAIAQRLAPDAEIALEPGPPRAQLFYGKGIEMLRAGWFTDARQYLEQAVDADPQLADAWYALVLAMQWNDADIDAQHAALRTALALAPPGPERELLAGVGLVGEQRWSEARARLEPLEAIAAAAGSAGPSARDLAYFLGEANWHDGRHDAGFGYFSRAFKLDARFRPPLVHMWQYLVARRSDEAARYVALAGGDVEWADFALRRYDELARGRAEFFAVRARLVGQLPLTADDRAYLARDASDARVLRIAIALGGGDERAAPRELAELHDQVKRHPGYLDGTTGEELAEVLIAAELGPEARELLSVLDARQPSQSHRLQRLEAMAALVARDAGSAAGGAGALDRANRSERTRREIDAVEAELAGRRDDAVAIWQELVANPSWTWDYLERAVLLRDLAALGPSRKRDRDALCADTMTPAVFYPAWLVVRRLCL